MTKTSLSSGFRIPVWGSRVKISNIFSTAFIGGRIMGIFTRSRMKDEAWAFIKFLSRPESQVKLYEVSLETEDSYLPPNMETWKKLKMDSHFKKVLEDQARDAKGPPPVLGWDASSRFVNHAIQQEGSPYNQ